MVESLLGNPVVIIGLITWTLIVIGGAYLLLKRVIAAGGDRESDTIRRVVRNSAIPIASQFFIRGMDLVVAIVVLRLLGPQGNGQYAIAVIVWLYVKTISDFGLSMLATREIARDHTVAGRMVGTTTLLRLGVLAVAALPVSVYAGVGFWTGTLSSVSLAAIAILYLSIVPSSYSEAVNSALNGIERMDVAAWLNIGVNLVRAPLVILLASTSLEVVGVAAAALVASLLSADLFRRAFHSLVAQPIRWSIGWSEAIALARMSWPLLVNALLVNLFFRIDVFLVQAFRGDVALGMYDASYKLVNLVTIIPAYMTLAIFPSLATRSGSPALLTRTYRMASYVLVWVAWGIVVGVTALSETAIRVLAGSAYLPEAAVLLRLLIWFAPLSFLNGVIQYVLIAADQQRRIVPVFMAAVVFNLLANVMLIPFFGARAAAVNTVATEVVILLVFAVVARRTSVSLFSRATIGRLWRPTVAGVAASAVAVALLTRVPEPVTGTLALALFAFMSVVMGVFGDEERELFRRALGRERPVGA